MRPTTSTTNNSKNIRQISKFWKFVSTPFSRDQNSIQQFDEFFVARRFRGLTHSRYNFKWDRGAASQIWFWDPCFGEKNLLSRRKMKLIVILHHGYGWSSRIYVKLWQVGPYSYLRNFPELWETEGRRPADLLIGNGNTNLRDASYEITKPNPLLIEKSHVADTKEGSVNLIDWERDDRKREKLYDTLQLKLLEGRYANS